MSTSRYFRFRQKSTLITFAVALLLLNATISTPSLKTLGPGANAPEFNLADANLKETKFKDLLGQKLTIIIFWASWSKKSEEALSQMQELYAKQAKKGLHVIGINVEQQNITPEDRQTGTATFKKLGLTFPNLYDRSLETFKDYGVVAVPTTVVIDKDAKIVFEMSGYPLVKAGELTTYTRNYLEGKTAEDQAPSPDIYHPQKKAARYFNLGIKAQKSARTAGSAENYLLKATAADPQFIQPHIALAQLYRFDGELGKAQKQLEQALAINSGSAPALFESGMILTEQGDYGKATVFFEKSVTADEYFTPSYYLLGYLTGQQGDVKTAESFFAQSEEQNPIDYKIDLYRGKMYESQGNVEKATAAYRHSLQLLLGIQ